MQGERHKLGQRSGGCKEWHVGVRCDALRQRGHCICLMTFLSVNLKATRTPPLRWLDCWFRQDFACDQCNQCGPELGHRASLPERLMSKLLYMPCLYMHFFIEHNFGHHLNVATPADGATARYNQSVYGFWFTSVTKQYVNAWRLQMELLKRQGDRSFRSKTICSGTTSSNRLIWAQCGSCFPMRPCCVQLGQG